MRKKKNYREILKRIPGFKIRNILELAVIASILFSILPSVSFAEPAPSGNGYYFDVESGQGGWQTDGLWHITANRYNSYSHSFWYGNEDTKTYNTGSANSGSLTSPEIALAAGTEPVLNFWYWYQTEPNQNYDKKTVQISVDGGAWTDLKTITDTQQIWIKDAIELSDYAGKNVRIRFLFDTVDGSLNNYEGWYVDNIWVTYGTVSTTAPAPISAPAPAPTPAPTPVYTAAPDPTPAPNPSGKTYYVAKNGYDGNPGTESQPWQTISKAANTAVAGDTVYVKQGTYSESVYVKNSGSQGNYITFAAYPGQTVTIDGSGLSMSFWQGLFNINGKSYIKVSGFQMTNSPEAGIHVDSSDHIIIEKNSITNTELSPIKVGWGYSSNIVIDGNYVDRPYRSVWDSGSYSGPSTNKGWEEGISLSNVDTVDVKNNNVVRNGKGECIVMKDGTKHANVYKNTVNACSAVGIYVGGWEKDQSDFNIYQNVASNSKQGIMIASEKGAVVQGVNIYDNVVRNNEMGIDISSYAAGPSYPPNMKDISIVNNVAYGNSNSGIIIENDRGNNMRVSNVVIRNNIASSNSGAQIATGSAPYVTGASVDHNLAYGTKGYYENDGAYSINADPQFVNPGGSDFHLKSSSPAIDAGSSSGAPGFDLDGNYRPQGNGYDIGAYEY